MTKLWIKTVRHVSLLNNNDTLRRLGPDVTVQVNKRTATRLIDTEMAVLTNSPIKLVGGTDVLNRNR